MAKKILPEPPVYRDTRGIPEGFDPGSIIRYRYDTLVKSATGLESLVYKMIPYSYIRSWAIALDPTYKFKISPGTITAVNRTRERATLSVTGVRKRRRMRYFTSWSQQSNYKGIAVCSSPYLVYSSNTSLNSEGTLPSLPAQRDVIKDTTARTRIIGSTQGELEFFKSDLNSPERRSEYAVRYRWYTSGANPDATCTAAGGTRDYEVGSDEVYVTTFGPSAAVFPEATLTALRTTEIDRCKSLCADYAPSLLANWSPYSRDYSLARNFAELKDLPRSVVQARQTMTDLKALYSSLSRTPKTRDSIFDLSNRAASNIPGEYLSYHFGWKQVWKDLRDLVALPEKLSKRFNFLLRRSGKQTTFRSKRDYAWSESGLASGFVYDHTNGDKEWNCSSSHRKEGLTEIRLVINAVFDFPPLNVPHLRQRFFADKVGLIPRFTDVYNIIPYTWLIDWFTGLGNYIEMIEEINHDPGLINWGFITANTRGKVSTEFSFTNATWNDIYVNGLRISPTVATDVTKHHTSVLDFECQTRMNVARVFGVERTTEPNSLTGYRQSILGALIAQRIDNTRSGTFRPRS